MSWDLSSEEVIVDKLENQQRTIFAFSKKIKGLEEKLDARKESYKEEFEKYLKAYHIEINQKIELQKQLAQAKKIIRSLITSDSLEIGWGEDIGEARDFLDKLEEE